MNAFKFCPNHCLLKTINLNFCLCIIIKSYRNILMMFKSLTVCSLLIANVSLLPVDIVTAQNPPAKTYQPGFWQPAARVDVNLPISINLINQAGVIINYSITSRKTKPVPIQLDQTITLNDVEPPLYIVIYPDSNNPNSSLIYLQYEVKVTEKNVIEVEIKTTEDGSKSSRSFNLQDTGGIYIY